MLKVAFQAYEDIIKSPIYYLWYIALDIRNFLKQTFLQNEKKRNRLIINMDYCLIVTT